MLLILPLFEPDVLEAENSRPCLMWYSLRQNEDVLRILYKITLG